MMGSLGQAQNDTESIAQFMQRLSQATNIFISPEDPTGKETFSVTASDAFFRSRMLIHYVKCQQLSFFVRLYGDPQGFSGSC